jgi:hypothetical protein
MEEHDREVPLPEACGVPGDVDVHDLPGVLAVGDVQVDHMRVVGRVLSPGLRRGRPGPNGSPGARGCEQQKGVRPLNEAILVEGTGITWARPYWPASGDPPLQARNRHWLFSFTSVSV